MSKYPGPFLKARRFFRTVWVDLITLESVLKRQFAAKWSLKTSDIKPIMPVVFIETAAF